MGERRVASDSHFFGRRPIPVERRWVLPPIIVVRRLQLIPTLREPLGELPVSPASFFPQSSVEFHRPSSLLAVAGKHQAWRRRLWHGRLMPRFPRIKPSRP